MPVQASHRLHDLLGLEDLDAFLRGPWESAPLLARATFRGREEHLLTLDQLEALMGGALAGSHAGVSVVQDERARPVARSTAPAERMDTLLDAYRAGNALLFAGLQRLWAPIARLCRGIENDLVARRVALSEAVGANAYLSPGRSRGFGVHYDNHCVVVLQLHGRKSWEIFAPEEALPVERCERTIARERLGAAVLTATLEVGDVLYVPRGSPHVAFCEDVGSLHLTLSLRTLTWLDLLASMGAKIPALRRSVPPPGGDQAEIHRVFEREILSALATLDPADAARRRAAETLSNLAPLPGGRVRAIDEAPHVGHETPLLRAPLVECQSQLEDGQSVLRFPGRAARLPAAMQPVLDFIAERRAFRASDLPAGSATYEADALVRLLVAQGLLRPDGASENTSSTATAEESAPAQIAAAATSPAPVRPVQVPETLTFTFRRGDGPDEGAHLGWLHSVERLSAELCEEIADACREFPSIPPTTVGEERYPGHRQADARKVGVSPRTQWVFNLLGRVAAEVSQSITFLHLTEIARAPQYVEYRPGWGRFDWHNDYSHGQPFAPRKLTIILQLSDGDTYEGGSLEVFGNEVAELPRQQGSILVFPSILPHRVTPVTAGVRRALVAWIAGPRLS